MFNMVKKQIIFVICLLFTFTTTNAQPMPSVLWNHQYGNEPYWYKYKAMSITKNGDLLIATSVKSMPGSSNDNMDATWLWRIDQKGVKVEESEIKKSLISNKVKNSNAIDADVRGVAALESGDRLLVIDFTGESPWIIKISAKGGLLFAKEILGSARRAWISRIIPTFDNGFLLIGHELLDSIVIKVDSAGDVVWENKQDRGGKDLYVDGVAMLDGSSVLVGNSGEYDMLLRGQSMISIYRFDAAGLAKSEKRFAGRNGSIARSADGGFVIVYDKGNANGQDIWVQALGPALQELWQLKVIVNKPSVPPASFKIKTALDGNYIIVGGKDGKPYIEKIDKKGARIWEYWGEFMDISVDYDLYVAGTEFYVAFTTFIKNTSNIISQKVNIIKFTDR